MNNDLIIIDEEIHDQFSFDSMSLVRESLNIEHFHNLTTINNFSWWEILDGSIYHNFAFLMRGIATIGNEIKLPMLINLIEGGKTPNLPISDLEELGFRLILYPLTSIFATAYSMQKLASHVRSEKTTRGYDEILTFSEFENVVDLQKYKDLDSKFLSLKSCCYRSINQVVKNEK